MSSTSEAKDDSPDQIGPDRSAKPTFAEKGRRIVKAFTTKDGLIGDYDYGFLFTPNIPFMKKQRRAAPFFGLNEKMPVLLAFLLGFQHALAMLAGIITPPIILSSAANLEPNTQSYLVSTSLIVCGILSSIQITRFHIYKTPYFVGTGLISVVGTSFATIPVATGGKHLIAKVERVGLRVAPFDFTLRSVSNITTTLELSRSFIEAQKICRF